MIDGMLTVDHGVPVSPDFNTVCLTNEEGFSRILHLYARPGDTIVDPTYGNGVFWKKVDRSLYQEVLTDWKDQGVDLRALPLADGMADMVVNDPPYRYTPRTNKRHEDSPGCGKVDGQYNLQASAIPTVGAVLDLYYAGMKEAHRVLKQGGFLVVKCQDTVASCKNVWVHLLLMHHAEALGFACRDLLVVTPPAVLKSRWDMQRHLRKAHSYFLVFRKGGHFPFGIPTVGKRNGPKR